MMIRSLRAAALIAGTSIALFAACGTAAARSNQPGASCGSGSSAVNQYCENIPSANGRGTPAPGQPQTGPQLGSSLPPAAAKALHRRGARKRAHNLLLLPAPAHVSASLGGQGGGLGVPAGVIIALALVAVTGGVAMYARSRQGRAP